MLSFKEIVKMQTQKKTIILLREPCCDSLKFQLLFVLFSYAFNQYILRNFSRTRSR